MNPLGRSTAPYFPITDLESAPSVVMDHGEDCAVDRSRLIPDAG